VGERKRESEREKEREREKARARERGRDRMQKKNSLFYRALLQKRPMEPTNRSHPIECKPACVYEQCSFLSEEQVREICRERERERDRESIHTYMKRIYCGIMEVCV